MIYTNCEGIFFSLLCTWFHCYNMTLIFFQWFQNFRSKLNEICRQKFRTNPADDKPTAKFAQKAVELCWWMCVQDPPVHMCLTKKEPFNPALYKAYTKSGSEPDYFVWPALKLYRDGGVLSKGVAQFKWFICQIKAFAGARACPRMCVSFHFCMLLNH